MTSMLEKAIRIPTRLVHCFKRAALRQPAFILRMNHPLSAGMWDRQKGLRGWVASDKAVTAATFREADREKEPAEFEQRPDVEYHLRFQFRYHRGFFSPKPVEAWLRGRTQARIIVELEFSDGSRGQSQIDIEDAATARAEKFARYRDKLRCPETGSLLDAGDGALVAREGGRRYPITDGIPDFLAEHFKHAFSIDQTDNISSWDYDQKIVEMIEAHPDWLFLDCGAGLRRVAYPNVINYEIVKYSSTDIMGVAEKLPFADASLDGVISVAVLEHVKDPFRSAAEIMRVLKPGGVLFCSVPFMQPLHGYPHHYYNMTAEGIKNLFPALEVEDVYVPLSLHPIQAIRWMLFSYAQGLPQREQKEFEQMRVKDIFRLPQFDQFYQKQIPFIHRLSAAAMTEVAAGHCLIARKPGAANSGPAHRKV